MKLAELGRRRFIGDVEEMIVHDRWNPDCEGCFPELLVDRGVARGFEPDTLDRALWEGYEYCPDCFTRDEPRPPEWADLSSSRPDDVPPAWQPSRLIPRGPILSGGEALSMESKAREDREAA